jgi:hypothetical protein
MNHKRSAWSEPQGKMGRKLFPNFPVNDVAAIHIKTAGDLHLAAKDGIWRVQERAGYPADPSKIRDLLITMLDLKISQSEPIGPSQLAHMELEPPGKGTNSGTLVEFMDKQGKTLQSLSPRQKTHRGLQPPLPLRRRRIPRWPLRPAARQQLGASPPFRSLELHRDQPRILAGQGLLQS